MEIAELFVSLGIKGSDKTVKAFEQIEGGLKKTAAMSIEAKAAIVGAGYALQSLFAQSGAQGTALSQFGALMGGGIQTLQKYQYAARQVGIANEDTEATFKNLAATATKQRLGLATPALFGTVSAKVGGLTGKELQDFEHKPELYLQKLQQYAQAEKDIGVRNQALRSFGLSDQMIAALSQKSFTQDKMKGAPTYSDKEVANLNSANIAWSNLGTKIQMAIGHFNAAHGGALVRGFSILVDLGVRLANGLVRVAEKTKFFDTLKYVFDKIEQSIPTVVAAIAKLGPIIDETINDAIRLAKAIGGITGQSISFGGFQKQMQKVGGWIDEGIDKFKQLKKFLSEYAVEIKLGDSLTQIFEDLDSVIADTTEAFQNLWNAAEEGGAVSAIVEGLKAAVWLIVEGIKTATEGLRNLASAFAYATTSWEASDEVVGDMGKGLKDLFMGLIGSEPELAGAGAGASGAPGAAGAPGQAGKPGQPGTVTPIRPLAPRGLPTQADVIPRAPRQTHTSQDTNQQIQVTQTFNVTGDAKDMKQTARTMDKSIINAWQNIQSKTRGN